MAVGKRRILGSERDETANPNARRGPCDCVRAEAVSRLKCDDYSKSNSSKVVQALHVDVKRQCHGDPCALFSGATMCKRRWGEREAAPV